MKIFKTITLSLLLANSLFAKIEFKALERTSTLSKNMQNRIENLQVIESIFDKYFTSPFTITSPSITTKSIKRVNRHKIRIINTPTGSIRVIDKIVLQRSTSLKRNNNSLNKTKFITSPMKTLIQFTQNNLAAVNKQLSIINSPLYTSKETVIQLFTLSKR